jgi:hypothetical protein
MTHVGSQLYRKRKLQRPFSLTSVTSLVRKILYTFVVMCYLFRIAAITKATRMAKHVQSSTAVPSVAVRAKVVARGANLQQAGM